MQLKRSYTNPSKATEGNKKEGEEREILDDGQVSREYTVVHKFTNTDMQTDPTL